MADNKFVFKDAEEARDDITKRDLKEIRKLYTQWSREIKQEYKAYRLNGGSDVARMRELAKMYYNMRNASKQMSYEINNLVVQSVTDMSDIVVRVNQRWLKSLGIDTSTLDVRYSYIKNNVVTNIITGNLYQDKKPLSGRVWDLSESHTKDIYTIIAKGIAQDMSIYDIAKLLEKYVNPRMRLPMYDGIHNRTVDYNAMRLARTMVQHSYQNTLVGVTRNNPYVKGYIWHVQSGHPCELCQERDGNFYTASDIPLDHPNGQCTFEIVTNINLNPNIYQ